jgi:hypothetical protein
MSGIFQQGAFEEAWQTRPSTRGLAASGRWSWPVSLAVIGGLSVLGWSAAILGLARFLGA